MLQQEIILDVLTPLSKSATLAAALLLMEEHKVKHLPVVNNTTFVGLISEDDCLDAPNEMATIEEAKLNILEISIEENQHIFDALKLFSDFKLSMLPVVDNQKHFLGYLSPEDVLQNMGSILSIASPGSVLVLEVESSDFHLSQIAQIVESGDAKILMFYLNSNPKTSLIEVTLKINRQDLSSILQTFERYNYSVIAKYHQSKNEQDLKFRYDNLMKYLNI